MLWLSLVVVVECEVKIVFSKFLNSINFFRPKPKVLEKYGLSSCADDMLMRFSTTFGFAKTHLITVLVVNTLFQTQFEVN